MKLMEKKHPSGGTIHNTLAHAYSFYLFALVAGLAVSVIYPVRVYESGFTSLIGVFLPLAGTALIFWEKSASAAFSRAKDEARPLQVKDFMRGPYAFTKSPEHLGLSAILIGLAFLLGSAAILVFTLIASLVSHLFYLGRGER